MNLAPHASPKMGRDPRYRHKVASFRKNSMERGEVTLEEYNGIDLVNVSVARDSSGRHSLNKMRGTARFVSLQVKQLPQLIEALQEAERAAIRQGLLEPKSEGVSP